MPCPLDLAGDDPSVRTNIPPGQIVLFQPGLAPTVPTDLSSNIEAHESGLEVKEITLDSGEYGGKFLECLFSNAGNKECYGPTIYVVLPA